MSLTDGDKESQRAFARLRPLCTQLLEVSSTSPEERGVVLDALQRVLREIDPTGLQRCMDYVLLPLLLLLDGAVSCRTPSLREKSTAKNPIMMIGDRVAENILSCVEIVLQRCRLEAREQMIMMLRKLTGAALLSASDASEEFRHGVLKCLKALLANLKSCNSAFCVCQSVYVSPFEALKQSTWNLVVVDSKEIDTSVDESDLCPMGLLQTETMAPAIGHLISLLLQIAEAEASRGGVGSGKLRRDALSTLRLLFLKVGSADALAFFLPGAVRGLATVMRFTKAQVNSGFSTPVVHVSGAAGWPAVVEEAIRGMAEILAIVMRGGEKFNDSNSSDSVTTTAEPATLDAAFDYLQDLSFQFRKSDKGKSSTDEDDQPKMGSSTMVVHQNQKVRGKDETASQDVGAEVRSFRTERNKKWLKDTATRVHTFLSQTLPLLCAHPSASVRLAVVDAATVLLVNCEYTLEICNSLLLECLLALACDEFEHVASAAQMYLSRLMGFRRSMWSNSSVEGVDQDIDPIKLYKTLPNNMTAILSSLVEQLPKVIFSSNAAMALSHGRRLAAAMYFSGPEGVSSRLLGTPIDRQRFTTVFKQCLSFSSAFTGSLGRITSNPSAHSPVVSEILPVKGKHTESKASEEESVGVKQEPYADEIPSMPPWLPVGTGSRLYSVLADVLRLVGVSAISDQRNGTTLFGLVELLLVDVRLAASNQKMCNYNSGSVDFESGQKQRAAATSACVLNEIIYGASGEWNEKLFTKFQQRDSFKALKKPASELDSSNNGCSDNIQPAKQTNLVEKTDAKDEAEESRDVHSLNGKWQGAKKEFVKKALSECVGDIIHDYLSAEIWDEPTDLTNNSVIIRGLSSPNKHQDIVMLQKVLVEGVGVLGIALGKAFEESGVLRLVLFPLLEKLASPNYYVSQAAAMSLNAICFYCQYTSVKDLVVANVDYVVDFMCRQFRHLKMHPQSLNLLAAILRHTNTAPDLLPLLGEPLQCVVMELDVMARTSNPQLTVPLLRAMREILRAASREVDVMLSKATNAAACWRSLSKVKMNVAKSASEICRHKMSKKMFQDSELEEQVEEFLDRIRHRQGILKVATSCVLACGPLLASKNSQTCLFSLDVIADGISTLSDAEEAGRYEEECRQALKEHCTLMDDFQSSIRCVDMITKDESETNKLLPTMHRIWKYLVICLRQGRTSVIVRALDVMALITTKCGGEFFTRRLKEDVVPTLVGHLSQGLFATRSKRRSYPLVPHKYSNAPEHGPGAMLKVQHAVLKSITSIAADKKSAPALHSSFEVLASWVVVLACEVEALRVAATETALALSTLNSDFIWILVADLISGVITEEFSQVTLPGFPDFNTILPAWSSQADALWCQYIAYRGEFRAVDKDAAQHLLAKLEGLPTTWT